MIFVVTNKYDSMVLTHDKPFTVKDLPKNPQEPVVEFETVLDQAIQLLKESDQK